MQRLYLWFCVYLCVVTKYLFNVTFIACDIEQKTLLYLFLRFCYLLFCCHWYISLLLYLFNIKSFCFSTFVIAYRSKELRKCSKMFFFKQIKYTSSLFSKKGIWAWKLQNRLITSAFCTVAIRLFFIVPDSSWNYCTLSRISKAKNRFMKYGRTMHFVWIIACLLYVILTIFFDE